MREASEATEAKLRSMLSESLGELAGLRARMKAVQARDKVDGSPQDAAQEAISQAEAALAAAAMLLKVAQRPSKQNLHLTVPRVLRTARKAKEAVERASGALRARAVQRDREQAEADLSNAKRTAMEAIRQLDDDVLPAAASLQGSHPAVADEGGVPSSVAKAKQEAGRIRDLLDGIDSSAEGSQARMTALRQLLETLPNLPAAVGSAARTVAAATQEAQRRDEEAREARRRKEVRDQAVADSKELGLLRERLQKAQHAAGKLSHDDVGTARGPLDEAGRAVVAAETIRSMLGNVGAASGAGEDGDSDSEENEVNEDFARQLGSGVSDARRKVAEAEEMSAVALRRALDARIEDAKKQVDDMEQELDEAEAEATMQGRAWDQDPGGASLAAARQELQRAKEAVKRMEKQRDAIDGVDEETGEMGEPLPASERADLAVRALAEAKAATDQIQRHKASLSQNKEAASLGREVQVADDELHAAEEDIAGLKKLLEAAGAPIPRELQQLEEQAQDARRERKDLGGSSLSSSDPATAAGLRRFAGR